MKRITLLFAFLVMSMGMALAQSQVEVSGTVISAEDNQPIIGATVRGKTSKKGDRTNIDGKFKFTVPANEKIIIVSFVGMKTREVAVGKNLKVLLQPDATTLEEVTITVPFGTAKKSSFTGSATVISSKELSKSQVSNVTKALEGKIPGVSVTSSNNQPGQSASISIRGVGSFNAKTTPLYVVDGVPFDGDISSINPSDIESTTTLKDATSAALYGARGANGVIMIQTKSGSAGKDKLTVTLDARYGFNQRGVADYDYITDPKVYAAKYFEGIYYDKVLNQNLGHEAAMVAAYETYFSTDTETANLVYHPFSGVERNQWFSKDEKGHFYMNPAVTIGAAYTGTNGKEYWLQPDNWTNEVFATNPRQEYNLSLSGRSDKANYYLSTGYLNDKGYIVASGFERFTARLRGDFDPAKWLRLGGNIGFTYYTNNGLSDTQEGGDSGNIFAVTNYIAPIYPLYVRGADKQIIKDAFGHTLYDFGVGSDTDYAGLKRPYLGLSNPMSLYELDKKEDVANIISLRGYADFMPYKGLKLTLNAGYDSDNTYSLEKRNLFYGQFAESGGIIYREFSRISSINLQQLLNYNKSFGKHNFDVLLGHEFYKRFAYSLYGQKTKYLDPNETEISGAILSPGTGSSKAFYATEGYLGRLQYDFDSKYFAQFSYRRDASSRFHKSHRWGDFWSLGASWLLSRESFMRDLKFINLLKLKLSYGQQGNDNINNFLYLDRYQVKNSNDKLSVGFYAKGNEKLTWEKSANLNTGIEFALFENRISGGIDVYSREVSDMLFFRKTPNSAGYNGYYDNVGSMRNTGIDIELSAIPFRNEDITWTVSFNTGYFKNTLTKLPEDWEARPNGYRDGFNVYRVGGSIYDKAYPKYLGLTDKGTPKWQTYDAKTGEYGSTEEYSEARKEANREIYTDIRPMWRGGFSTTLELYGFDLSASFSYGLGGRMMDTVYSNLMHNAGGGSDSGQNLHKDILNSWTPENKDTDVPRLDYSGKDANAASDRFLISRNYLAVNNLTIGYRVPNNLLKKVNLSGLRLYVVGDNLGLLSARKGFDPRFGGGVGYKAIRTISFGMNLTL